MDAETRRGTPKSASALWRSCLLLCFLAMSLNFVVPDCVGLMPYSRSIYFKLPLEQTQFHWEFQERDLFLSGKLTLSLKSKSRSEVITVFEDGKISEGWEEIGGRSRRGQNHIYFGFVSHKKYRVSTADEVEIYLRVVKDLKGIGPDSKGILKAGEYKSKSTFTVYWTGNDTAFLRKEDATPQWKLIITENTGWMASRSGTRKR